MSLTIKLKAQDADTIAMTCRSLDTEVTLILSHYDAVALASHLVELATQGMVDIDRKELAEARWPTTTTTTSGS